MSVRLPMSAFRRHSLVGVNIVGRSALRRTSALSSQRQYSGSHFRRASSSSRWTVGAGVTGLLVFAMYSLNELHLEAPADRSRSPRSSAEKDSKSDTRLDPATSLPFPITLPKPQTRLPLGREGLQLVGLGVRTVSFLGIRVYVAALYIDAKALQSLSELPGWKGFEADWMMGKTSANDVHSSEALLSTLLESGATCAIRIVPTRSTDFNHLKDGFTRAVQNRAKLARKEKELDADADEALNKSLQTLKEAFPKASLPKGRALDLLFIPSGSGLDLTLEEDGRVLGSVLAADQGDKRYTLARQLFLAYFANKDEISKPFKESVAKGLESAFKGRE